MTVFIRWSLSRRKMRNSPDRTGRALAEDHDGETRHPLCPCIRRMVYPGRTGNIPVRKEGMMDIFSLKTVWECCSLLETEVKETAGSSWQGTTERCQASDRHRKTGSTVYHKQNDRTGSGRNIPNMQMSVFTTIKNRIFRRKDHSVRTDHRTGSENSSFQVLTAWREDTDPVQHAERAVRMIFLDDMTRGRCFQRSAGTQKL